MVIDDPIVVAGSFNYTAPANEYNDENIFVIGSPIPGPAGKDGGRSTRPRAPRSTGFFRAEIERIIHH